MSSLSHSSSLHLGLKLRKFYHALSLPFYFYAVIFISILVLAPTLSKYALLTVAPSSIHLNTLLLPISRSLVTLIFLLSQKLGSLLHPLVLNYPTLLHLVSLLAAALAQSQPLNPTLLVGARHFSFVNLLLFIMHLLKPSSRLKRLLSLSNSSDLQSNNLQSLSYCILLFKSSQTLEFHQHSPQHSAFSSSFSSFFLITVTDVC